MSASRSTGGLSHMLDDQSRAPRNIIKIERCSAIISRKAKRGYRYIAPHYASGEPSASHPMSYVNVDVDVDVDVDGKPIFREYDVTSHQTPPRTSLGITVTAEVYQHIM
eukprot:scaffold66659_cov61-Attheya_sp.AAC.2